MGGRKGDYLVILRSNEKDNPGFATAEEAQSLGSEG